MSRVLLIGLGVEGMAAARYFLAQGDEVIAADQRAASQPAPSEFAENPGFHWHSEEKASGLIATCDLVLRSPGVPPRQPLVTTALTQGRNVTTPTGYWLGTLSPEGTITVTGSKGKSTTVSLIVRMMTVMGLEAAPHGNIGLPPLDTPVAGATHPVLELSSYMLHDAPEGPYFHLVTNLFREHTPWHGSEEAYHAAKLRPFRFSAPRPGLAPRAVIETHGLGSHVRAFEDVVPLEEDTLHLPGGPVVPTNANDAFGPGPSLLALRAATAAVLEVTGTAPSLEDVLETARGYTGLPSRQEIVPSTDGRLWINDALATVPEATAHALYRHKGKDMTLLLGGADREQAFTRLAEGLTENAAIRVLIFGSVADRLADALTRAGAAFTRLDSYEAALKEAARVTPTGGVILFSPAAASDPAHGNYTVRADLFREAANAAS